MTTQINTLDGQTLEVPPPTDEQRVGTLAASQQELKELQEHVGRQEMAIQQILEERKATTMFGKDGLKYVITIEDKLDYSKMTHALEFLEPAERDKCYFPAHTEIKAVPASWHKGRVNDAVRAHGVESDLGKAVAAATFPGAPKGKLVKGDGGYRGKLSQDEA